MKASAAQCLGVVPIDEAARNGRFQLVFAAGRFALVRWIEDCWLFPSGQRWPLQPTHYRPHEDSAHV